VNKLRTGLLIGKKKKHKPRLLTEEKLGDIAQETGVSKCSARMATQLLKLRPYKTTVIHALQLRDSASRVRFCNWFLQSVIEDEINAQLTFFSDEAWFHLQGYMNTHRSP
jgi:hypothetical protein